MTGLNDDFPLDDEENIVQISKTNDEQNEKESDEDPSHMLSLDADLNQYSDIVEKLTDAIYLKESLDHTKGVSQEIALSIESIFPGFINDDKPINYFTKHVSKTQYSVTVESINDNIASLLKKLLELIKQIINKFVNYIKSTISARKNTDVVFDTEYQNKASRLLKRISDIAKDKDKSINEIKNKTKSVFKDVDADDFFNRLEERFSALNKQVENFYSYLNSKNLIKIVIFKPEVISKYHAVFENKFNLINAFEIIGNYSVKVANGNSTIDYVEGYEDSDHFKSLISKLKVSNLNITPSQAFEILKYDIEDVSEKNINKETINLFDIKDKFDKVIDRNKIKATLVEIDSLQDKLTSLQNTFTSAINKNYLGNSYQIKIAKDLMKNILKEFNAFFAILHNYISIMNNYLEVNERLKDLMAKYERDIYLSTVTMDKVFTEYIQKHFD